MDIKVDRTAIYRLNDQLTHMISNTIDHVLDKTEVVSPMISCLKARLHL